MDIQDIIRKVKPELDIVRSASVDGKIRELKKRKPGLFAPAYQKKAYDAKIRGLQKLKKYYDVSNIRDLESIEKIFSSTDLSDKKTIEEAKKGLDAIKSKWISNIGGDKGKVTSFVNKKVKELEDRYGDNYAAIVGTLKKILRKKYPKAELEEESQGEITTGNIGSPTMVTGEPANFGSSAVFAPKVGSMMSRRGDISQKKKKEKIRKFVEYYFQ